MSKKYFSIIVSIIKDQHNKYGIRTGRYKCVTFSFLMFKHFKIFVKIWQIWFLILFQIECTIIIFSVTIFCFTNIHKIYFPCFVVLNLHYNFNLTNVYSILFINGNYIHSSGGHINFLLFGLHIYNCKYILFAFCISINFYLINEFRLDKSYSQYDCNNLAIIKVFIHYKFLKI